MKADVVLLVDDVLERGDVVQELVASLGYQVIRRSTAEQCRSVLLSSAWNIDLLLANAQLDEGSLMTVIEDSFRANPGWTPRLLVWSQDGEWSLLEHREFLQAHNALVFHLPLDVDLLIQVIYLIQDLLEPSEEQLGETSNPTLSYSSLPKVSAATALNGSGSTQEE